jgi:hypothetical protein
MENWTQLRAMILPDSSFLHIFRSRVQHFCIPPVCSTAPHVWSCGHVCQPLCVMKQGTVYLLTTDSSALQLISENSACSGSYIHRRLVLVNGRKLR